MSLSERVFRLFLLAYPASFRRRYRDDLVAFFVSDRKQPTYANGVAGFFRFWRKTIFDLLRTSASERALVVAGVFRLGPYQLYIKRKTLHRTALMEATLQDLRYAGRMLIRNPGLTTIALATLTLGIGINAAMFSMVNGVLLRQLPYTDSERVVAIWGTDTDGTFSVSENERLRYRDATNILSSFGTYQFNWANLTGPDGAERVVIAAIDDGVLPALGVTPIAGRAFTIQDTQPGTNPSVLLSHGMWQQRFAGNSGVVGTTIQIGGSAVNVAGVMPRDFRLPGDFVGQPVQLYSAQVFDEPDPRNLHYLRSVGRLAEGTTVERARTYLADLAPRMKEQLPTLPSSFVPAVTPVRDVVMGEIRPVLLILFAAVGLLLLIACVNVANIFLARSDSRATEMTLRVALGANRGRIVRQLMSESIVLSLIGGALGLIVAKLAIGGLVRFNPPGVPRIDQLGIGVSTFVFTALISCLTALLFGIVPAIAGSKQDIRGALSQGGRGATAGATKNRLRRAFVVAEIAFAMMLVTGAGLLVRSFVRLQSIEPGLTTDHVLTMQTTLPRSRYPNTQSARSFYHSLLGSIRSLPGVTNAGAVSALPLASDPGDWGIRIEGREEERLAGGRRPWADRIIVTDDYFETLDVTLVEGRTLTRADISEARQVVVINQTAASRYWPDGSALGKRFVLTTNIDSVYRTVVGITRNVKHLGLTTDVKPEMYLPHAQHPATAAFPVGTMNLVVRTAGDPVAIVETIRRTMRELDPDVPLSNIRTMDDVLSASTSTERLNVSLFTIFGVLALLLVSVGVYGVMSYLVSQRRKELGIRIALGAAPMSVIRMVLRQGMLLALIGTGVGTLGALTLGRLLSSLLYGVSWYDPVTFVTVPVIVTGVALLACVYPALRATRVDPIQFLRTD